MWLRLFRLRLFLLWSIWLSQVAVAVGLVVVVAVVLEVS
jgi:uncharacterized membrane protein